MGKPNRYRAFGRPGMQVTARGRYGSVPEGGLHQMNRRAAVKGVAGMGVAHPVWRYLLFQPGPAGGGVDDAADLGHIQRSPALAARKNGLSRR
jgi:hypothetical protein